MLTDTELNDLVNGKIPLSSLSTEEKLEVLRLLDEKTARMDVHDARKDLISFAGQVYPGYSVGAHHKHMAKLFADVASGKKKRIIINIAPRHGKSELTSYLFPAWFLGQKPDAKIIMATHTASLSEDFGRRVRNLITSEEYQRVFPKTLLAEDSKSAGAWNTTAGGKYYAVGVGGALAGRGADLLVIDDPHALEISTLIATPRGFVALGDLKVGDEVFGPDGQPTRVMAKSPVYYDRELYRVRTSDDEVIYADAEHLWNVRTSTRVNDPYRNLATKELVQPRSSPFMLPRHSGIQYPHRELPIDPWVLGAWLGDGTSSLGRMTAHPEDAVFMRGEFKRRGYETTDLADKFNFGVKGLWGQLKTLGVLNNKHIPEQYMTASFPQRMDLLCGLMDTDGNVTTNGQCVFHNKDTKLVDQVVEILRSLGRKCQRRSYISKGNFGTCEMHRVTFKLKDCALMPRKRSRTRTTHDKQHRSITVQSTGQRGAVQCITVEREDGLFLAGRGYVVTHNSEQDGKSGTRTAFDQAWSWYQTGPRQRLMWGGAIIVVMTRWSLVDLTARLLEYQIKNPDADQWEVVEFPAILETANEDTGVIAQKSLWPDKWPLEELLKAKASMDPRYWNAQYMQAPTSDNAAIIKRSMWREWTGDEPPKCDFVIQSWDTAHEAKTMSDYSACTTWGVWYNEEEKNTANVVLLDAFKDRMEFPELKQTALKHYRLWEPDAFIVEKKAAGAPLIQELRAMGIPVSEFSPSRGADKITRLNAVSDLFASGKVWAPGTRWAREVIEEVAAFPNGEHDDFVDTTSQALLRFRQGGFIPLDSDEPEEPRYFKSTRSRRYY